LTLHRPSNVDDPRRLRGILEVMTDLASELPVVWPVHPRSRKNLETLDLLNALSNGSNFKVIDPVGYLDMLALNRFARMILTDSGGLQEEATVLGVPCITLRHNTERPVTIEAGANRVAGNEPAGIRSAIASVFSGNGLPIRVPEFWDGRAAERVVAVLRRFYAEAGWRI
jgi:UDP-N-acetylglucosamine 2-epimerase (non-hydrolysing)